MASEPNPYLVMRECYLVSILDIKTELLTILNEYWALNGFLYNGPQHAADLIIAPHEIVEGILSTLLEELFLEKQSDLRNAGRLELTEAALGSGGVDERNAHQMAEDLFVRVINHLGMHLPQMTFSSHEQYQFKIMRHDLMIYKQ
jgi:hypothetical protein